MGNFEVLVLLGLLINLAFGIANWMSIEKISKTTTILQKKMDKEIEKEE